MSMQDGIMTMRPLDDGLAISPDATVTLAPGGGHIMFVGLIAPFEEGQRVPVSLNFERAGKIEAHSRSAASVPKGPDCRLPRRSLPRRGALLQPTNPSLPTSVARA